MPFVTCINTMGCDKSTARRGRFRSLDVWVVGPARFYRATLLPDRTQRQRVLTHLFVEATFTHCTPFPSPNTFLCREMRWLSRKSLPCFLSRARSPPLPSAPVGAQHGHYPHPAPRYPTRLLSVATLPSPPLPPMVALPRQANLSRGFCATHVIRVRNASPSSPRTCLSAPRDRNK